MSSAFSGLGGSFLLALGLLWLAIGYWGLRGLAPLGWGCWRTYLVGLASAGLGVWMLMKGGLWALPWLLLGAPLAGDLVLLLSALANRSPSLDPLLPFRDGLPGSWRSQEVSFPLGKTEGKGRGLLMVPVHCRGAGVVVAHGLGNNRECFHWKLFAALLAKGLAVLAIDLAGHGTRRREPLSYPQALEEVPAAVSYLSSCPELRDGKVGVLGVSLGGALALRAAGDDERIPAVVAFAAPYRLEVSWREILAEVSTLLSRPIFRLFREASIYHLLRVWARGRARLLMRPSKLIADLGVLEAVERIAPRPVLLIQGARDRAIRLDDARRIYQAAGPPKELVVLEGESHLTMLFIPQAIEAAARWFEQYLFDSNQDEGEGTRG